MARKKGKKSSKKSRKRVSKQKKSQKRQNVEPSKHKVSPKKPSKGIRILISYSTILAFIYVLYFILGLVKPQLLFLGGPAVSYLALFVDVILVIALIYLIYGLIHRLRWAWWFCIVWYLLSILNSIWIVYMMGANVYNILHELLVLSSLFIILINALIIWYIYSKRDYFISPHREDRFGKKDKAFIYSLVGFWVLLILISLTIGYNFYKDTTRMADSIVQELKDTTPLHAIEICETKQGNEKDICFVVFVTVFEKYDLASVCSRIDSDLYRFSCMQAKGQ